MHDNSNKAKNIRLAISTVVFAIILLIGNAIGNQFESTSTQDYGNHGGWATGLGR